jgi:transposase InsO family protein
MPQRHKKRRRLYHKDASIIRLRPTHPNHVWSIDFVHDKLDSGRSYKMLTVLDEYTRQALAVAVRIRMGAEGILEALYPLLLRREVLNAEWFTTTKQAQVVINQWLRQYNNIRPNQALNMRPPVPETLIRNGPELGG